jgi:hypothetical protein
MFGVAGTSAPRTIAGYLFQTHVEGHIFPMHPANDLSALYDAGVTDIGMWGFPSAGCSSVDNAESQRTWNRITATIARLGEARAA